METKNPKQNKSSEKKSNPMRRISIDKVTINFGAGANQALLEKGMRLVKMITGREPIKTYSTKRIPTWGIRPGLPIGCKQTLRREEAHKLLRDLLKGIDNSLKSSSIDAQGNISFGIKEYVDVPSIKYDPEIGILGFEVAITLTRPGYRVMRRKKLSRSISKSHRISKEEAINFIKQEFQVKFGEVEQ